MKHVLLILTIGFGAACGTDADALGIGAECAAAADCADDTFICITRFAGGYCGIDGCLSDADCPEASACVTDDGGTNYCARLCEDKVDCNANRTEEFEANCVGSITFVDADRDGKACEPPSSGG